MVWVSSDKNGRSYFRPNVSIYSVYKSICMSIYIYMYIYTYMIYKPYIPYIYIYMIYEITIYITYNTHKHIHKRQ
jgi:hypothetical protein